MLYLASQSPRRRQLLRQLHRSFRIVRSTHRESIRRDLRPSATVIRNAIGKALGAQLPRDARGVVIAADTVLYFRGRVIGKPKTMRAARRLLSRLSGKRHWVYTGLCLRDMTTDCLRTSYEKTKVTFQPLAPATMTRVLARVSPLDKAGGYAIQNDQSTLIARIEGSRSNVIGLPLERLRRELKACARHHRATH